MKVRLYERCLLCNALFWINSIRDIRCDLERVSFKIAWTALVERCFRPDCIIYLDVNDDVCERRQKERNRPSEQGGVTNFDYIRQLKSVHDFVYGDDSDAKHYTIRAKASSGDFVQEQMLPFIKCFEGVDVVHLTESSTVDDVMNVISMLECRKASGEDSITIAIVGNIAAGKSTLMKKVGALFPSVDVRCEDVDKWACDSVDLLHEYNKDAPRAAFPFQVTALCTMANDWMTE